MFTTHALPPLSGGKPKSLVILLHGLGADGQDLIGLGAEWRRSLPDTEFLAPDAPQACDMGPMGYQWFSLQDFSMPSIVKGVKEAAPALNAYIDELLKERALPASRLALVGFSQGTMMSLYIAPRRAESFACVVGYSGILVESDKLLAEKKADMPILLVHGTVDPVVTYTALGLAEKGLKAANYHVETLSCPGIGHGIDQAGLDAGGAFLKKALL